MAEQYTTKLGSMLCGYPADTPQKAGERYGALNYPFVYRIFSWCAIRISNAKKRRLCNFSCSADA